ncbi:metal-dependent hydrolase [bacterium]|nr:metal-dependent hydrolase [candidate division CSSED10-310 bacterium]
MEITYLGHSAVFFKTDAVRLVVDPFLEGNPQAALSPSTLDVDVIVVTHGHSDHIGDTVPIAKRTGALVIAPFELAHYLEKKGCRVHPMHIGGRREFGWGKIKLTAALHGSAVIEENGQIVYTGNPCGVILTLEGKNLYHAGDTGLTYEMELIGRMHPIDVAFLPIGDNYTMGPADAAEAVRLLNPRCVVPIHYNTWEVIEQNPESFSNQVTGNTRVEILKPGGKLTI